MMWEGRVKTSGTAALLNVLQYQIFRFEVSVNDAFFVQMFDTKNDLGGIEPYAFL